MAKLKDFFIGNADGETESQQSLFKDMFYKNNQKYEEITNNSIKFIISGPKGSGKTILGRYIKEIYEEQGIHCKILKSESVELTKLISFGEKSIKDSEIILFYKWFILLEFSKVIFEKKLTLKDMEPKFLKRFCPNNRKKFNEYSKAYNTLLSLYKERFNKGNYENSSINTLEQINSILSCNCDTKAIPPSKLGIKGELQTKLSEEKQHTLKPYFKMINQFEEYILICMKYHKVVLILDDIDDMKVKLDIDEKSRNFLEYLIIALKDLNSKFNEYKLTPNKCILLLRSDILDTLNKYSSNLNKILADRQVDLYWLDKDNMAPENHILMDMIFHKIRLSCSEYKNLSNQQLYYKLFPQKINGKSATNYLLDYSFGRPRDIIYYLSVIQKRFKDHDYFAPSSFTKCENAYSTLLKNELLNELSLHLDADYVSDLLCLISDFKRCTFYYNQIKKYYDENCSSYPNIIDLKKSLSELYSFGVLGNSYNINTDENSSELKTEPIFSWAYRRDGAPKINLNQKLSVHYGLRSALCLKNPKYKKKKDG